MAQLVNTPIPPDLMQAGLEIHEGIESGQITGMAVVVAMKGRRFFVDVFGALARDPYLARGYVASLDDCLREIGRAKKDAGHTL